MTKTLVKVQQTAKEPPKGGDGGALSDQSLEQDNPALDDLDSLRGLDETAKNERNGASALTEVFHPPPDNPDKAIKLNETSSSKNMAAMTNRDHPQVGLDKTADPGYDSIMKEASELKI